MQAVIGTDDGESYQMELGEQQAQHLTGMKIGDDVEGSVLGVDGYTLKITGGSDTEGFPMRSSVEGPQRRSIMVAEGTGVNDLEDGERIRKSVRGNTVSQDISQINLTVVEQGDEAIGSFLGDDETSDEAGEGE